MAGIEKSEISFIKVNFDKIKTIANFLDLPLDDVVNTSLYLGLYKIWLPIAKVLDEFPDWDLNIGEETEKLINLKKKFIKEIHTINKNFPKIERIERRFNNKHKNKSFNDDSERFAAFIDYVEIQLEERRPRPPKTPKPIKERVIPPKAKEPSPVKDSSVPEMESTKKIYFQFLLKSCIFALFFMAPIVSLLIISDVFFYWNYLAMLQYQPVLFFLLIFVMIIVGITFGWVSLLLIRYYQKNREERHEYEKFKEEFNEKIPFSEFEGTPTQWYQQFEKFIESKNTDNKGKNRT